MINRATKKEVTGSEYTEKLYKRDSQLYDDKMRVFAHPVDIVYATTDYINEGQKHPRKDNIVDFARGNILLEVSARQYSAEVVYGYTKNNVCELYDIVGIIPTSFQIKTPETSLTIHPQSTESGRQEVPDTSIIHDPSGKSNPQSKSSIPFGFSLGADVTAPTRRARFNRASVDEQAKRLMRDSDAKGDRADELLMAQNPNVLSAVNTDAPVSAVAAPTTANAVGDGSPVPSSTSIQTDNGRIDRDFQRRH